MPGIIIGIMLSQSILLIIDRRVGVIDSLKLSMQATHGNKLTSHPTHRPTARYEQLPHTRTAPAV